MDLEELEKRVAVLEKRVRFLEFMRGANIECEDTTDGQFKVRRIPLESRELRAKLQDFCEAIHGS